ncbi:hypothetical protein FNF31_05846 [Cafeteria roenbergensis]|uniref:Uncharacterized protein n=1 Tax=Cafeteria roenbergensis TaxID=33653 RepID=A0A5A8CUW6_CAFRO|nr:hypothetical protein FNF31_05846 [Cafeteria roenbergensis]
MASAARFRDLDGPTAVVEPSAAEAKATAEMGTETVPYSVASTGAQCGSRADAAVQTDSSQVEPATEASRVEGSWGAAGGALDGFRTAASAMDKALALGARSQAFDGLRPPRDDDNADPQLLVTLRPRFTQLAEDADAEDADADADADAVGGTGGPAQGAGLPSPLPCTAVAWTATGTVLAAAFGWPERSGWDTTACGVALWRVFAQGFSAESESLRPSVILPATSSLVSLACHPQLPEVIAAGSQTGEVLVWSGRETAGDGVDGPAERRPARASAGPAGPASRRAPQLLGASGIDVLLHQHPVRGLAWFRPVGSTRHLLLSGCEAGRMLVWDPLGAGMEAPVAGTTMRPSKVRPRMREADWPAMDDLDDDGDADGGLGGGRAGGRGGSRRRRGRGSDALADGVRSLCSLSDGSAAVVALQSGAVVAVPTAPLVAGYGGVGAAAAGLREEKGEWGGEEDARGHWGAVRARSAPHGAAVPWTVAAASLAAGAVATERASVVRGAERAASDDGSACVLACHVIRGRPSAEAVFPAMGVAGAGGPRPVELLAHESPALAVASSPLVRGLVASAAADGTVASRSTLQRTPVAEAVLAPMRADAATAVAFSHARPLVMACGGQGGGVSVMNGTITLASAAMEVVGGPPPEGLGVAADAAARAAAGSADAAFAAEAAQSGLLLPGAPGASVTGLAFSPTQRRVLAAADGSGCVRVWKLPWEWGQPSAGEDEAAARLVRGGGSV